MLHIIEKGVLAAYLLKEKLRSMIHCNFTNKFTINKISYTSKKIPIGETQAIISNKKNVDLFFFENKYVPIIIPINAP